MLTELRIKNFAIIESLTLPLAPGFNVLSGETGAGKSIIVEALGLLLGERANGDVVRTGAERASVEGVFDVRESGNVATALDAHGIEIEDGIAVLKREVTSAGRARSWINGTPVTATILGQLGRQLVTLHGQHEAQDLLDGDSQRRIFDAFGGAMECAEHVRATFDAIGQTRRELDALVRRRAEAAKRADYLRHVVLEIEAAKLSVADDERIEDEARRLEHAEELGSLATQITQAIDDGDDALLARLAAMERSLGAIIKIDPAVQRLRELYDAGYYAIEELGRELEAYEQRIDHDPERLADVRRRRDLVFRLTRKYGGSVQAVLETERESRAELDLVDSGGAELGQLEVRLALLTQQLADGAEQLTARRRESRGRLSAAVDEILPSLGIPGGHFDVVLSPLSAIGPHGAEEVSFSVSLNAGHAPRPLARVASGGELSRLMLAVKTILARLEHVPTLVFDEVDAGIGGRVALQVGDALRNLAKSHQLFAITHLPQLAARAHHHIVVSKGAPSGVTTADVSVVTEDHRVVEVARMLGGDPESEVSRAHARELLAQAPARRPTAKAARK